jgi:replication factor C large subunit
LEKGSGSALKTLCEVLKFTRVNVRSIPAHLARIAVAEQVEVPREVLEALATKADGDLRAAVRDLESLCVGRNKVTLADLGALGPRDTTSTLFDLVRHVLKGKRLDEVRREVWGVDATPEDLALWVDENLPKEYKDPVDLANGYDMLSRADVFLGRTRSTQNYGLWSYAGELSTLGVMTARTREYRDFVPFGFPQWLSKMGRTKGLRQTKDQLAESLGRATHSSKRKARMEQVEVFQALFASDREFAVEQTYHMELEDEEVVLLLGESATAKAVKEIRAEVEARKPLEDGPVSRKGLFAKAEAEEDTDDAAGPSAPAAKASKAGGDEDEGSAKKPVPGAGQKRLF